VNGNITLIRMCVFTIWVATLAVIIGVYIQKMVGNLSLSFSVIFQSMQILVGLVFPQLTLMITFYFNLDKQVGKIEDLTNDQVWVISLLSVLYHVIFIGAVIYGIGFYGFDRSADGNGLAKNTAAVAGIAGLFSVLLVPTALLFAKHKQ
jgi:hypothetical protein